MSPTSHSSAAAGREEMLCRSSFLLRYLIVEVNGNKGKYKRHNPGSNKRVDRPGVAKRQKDGISHPVKQAYQKAHPCGNNAAVRLRFFMENFLQHFVVTSYR